MKNLHFIAFILLLVGGLNWLFLALFDWEIGMIFGGSSATLLKVIYIAVGLAAIYEIVTHKGRCKACEKMGAPKGQAM